VRSLAILKSISAPIRCIGHESRWFFFAYSIRQLSNSLFFVFVIGALIFSVSLSAESVTLSEKRVVSTNLLKTASTSPKSTCAAFSTDDSISCVYLDWGGSTTRINLFELISKDGGSSWSHPVEITSNPGDEYDPFLSYDPLHKRLLLTYAKWHEDRGAAHNDVVIRHKNCPSCDWSPPVLVAGDGAHDYWIPSVLSLADGTILTFYSKDGPESSAGAGSGTIEVKRSSDNGDSWSEAIRATNMCDAEYPRAVQNSFGGILLVYGRYVDASHLTKGTNCADGVSNGYPYTDIHQVWSSDGGKSWSGDAVLFHARDGSALHPFVSIENASPQRPCAECRWDLLFIEAADGGFAVFRMQSSDQGLRWSPPTRYSTGKWSSPFNIDPGFTEGCKGTIINFTSGFGSESVFVGREGKAPVCPKK
jgi:hypothetical protein